MQIIDQLKVLVVEDLVSDYDLISAGLEEISINSVRANNISQMKEKLNEEKFDALLLDLCMGDTTGLDTIKTAQQILEKSTLNKDCPIIILSGLNDFSLINKALKMGVKDYLCKGEFVSSELKRALSFATVTKVLPKRNVSLFSRFTDRINQRLK